MPTPAASAVERAFQLAASCATVEEIRRALRAEGYANVDAHLAGRTIRTQLSALLGEKGPGGKGPGAKQAGGPTPA